MSRVELKPKVGAKITSTFFSVTGF